MAVALMTLLVAGIAWLLFQWKKGNKKLAITIWIIIGIWFIGSMAYDKMRTNSPQQSANINAQPKIKGTSEQSPAMVGNIEGNWTCTDRTSGQFSRLVLQHDGSIAYASPPTNQLFYDPWLRWYLPSNEPPNSQAILLKINIKGNSSLIVQYPSQRIDECTRL